ncbi:MAG: hypothetical protein U5K29_10305 [Acidimicrobiales bacterium]|nr:hypothetical protein [Acidimicrobiales bacterium]
MKNLLKFDGPRLEDLLERVQRELGPDVTIVDATRSRRGGFAGFFAHEWFEVVVEHDGATLRDQVDGPEQRRPADGAGADGHDDDPFLAMALAVDDRRETGGSVDDVGSPQVAEFALALASAQRDAAVGSDHAHHQTAAASVAAPSAAVSPMTRPRSSGLAAVPAPRTRRLRDLDLRSLLAHLDQLVPGEALPDTAAPVIAVVGDLASSRLAADALTAQLGLDVSDVVIARSEPVEGTPPWLEITTPGQARARASRWRGSGHATVLLVELAPGREGHAWAESMLQAVQADQVRLVAKAWQLSDHLAAKALALGGVDGLDVVEVDTAAEPELFLELDLPVLAIDGRRATSELWASLLYERRIDEHRDE